MSKLKLLIFTSGGFAAGICVQKHVLQFRRNYESLPGLPTFSTVSAATASILSPAPSSLVLPDPQNKDFIPPEPQKGISRVSEIMRFGFPGFDNVRSRK